MCEVFVPKPVQSLGYLSGLSKVIFPSFIEACSFSYVGRKLMKANSVSIRIVKTAKCDNKRLSRRQLYILEQDKILIHRTLVMRA